MNSAAYMLDLAAADRRRLAAVRQAQGGVALDQVVRLVRLMRQVAGGTPSQAKARDEIPAIVELEKVLGRPPVPVEITEPIELTRVLPQARRELEQVRTAGDRDRVGRAVDRLGQAVEWATLHALLSLAYTPYLDEATGPAPRTDPAMRHRFGVHEAGDDAAPHHAVGGAGGPRGDRRRLRRAARARPRPGAAGPAAVADGRAAAVDADLAQPAHARLARGPGRLPGG